tara:strand:+ start:6692 stop:7000 length:309 start_codon:yes stop_codon:yes gene_type:complete
MNNISVVELENLKSKIEVLDKSQQIEVLKILSKGLCKLNENKSGIYVNMSYISEDIIEELKKYIDYLSEQDEAIKTVEYQKEFFKNTLDDEEQENTITYTLG